MPDQLNEQAPAGELFNTPVAFQHGDKTYQSRKLTTAEIDEFCAWLERQAVSKAWYGSADLPPEGREAAMRAANAMAAAGAYRVGGEGYLEAMRQPAAGAYLLYLGLRNEHPDLTLDDCNAMFLAKAEERWRDALRGLDPGNGSGGRGRSSGPSKASSPGSPKKASRRKPRAV